MTWLRVDHRSRAVTLVNLDRTAAVLYSWPEPDEVDDDGSSLMPVLSLHGGDGGDPVHGPPGLELWGIEATAAARALGLTDAPAPEGVTARLVGYSWAGVMQTGTAPPVSETPESHRDLDLAAVAIAVQDARAAVVAAAREHRRLLASADLCSATRLLGAALAELGGRVSEEGGDAEPC